MNKNKQNPSGYNSALKARAIELRKNMTRFEKHLWYDFLKTYPVKFYRQRPIDMYIADFYCHKAKLAVELDGIQHRSPDAVAYDQDRTECLNEYGIMVLRFTNDEIDNTFQAVCEKIDRAVKDRISQYGS